MPKTKKTKKEVVKEVAAIEEVIDKEVSSKEAQELLAVIAHYKERNPAKYELKKAELESQLSKLLKA